jgi:hypothetical protein
MNANCRYWAFFLYLQGDKLVTPFLNGPITNSYRNQSFFPFSFFFGTLATLASEYPQTDFALIGDAFVQDH